MRVALEEAFARLVHDLADQRDHPLKIGSARLQADHLEHAARALTTRGDFLGKALGLPDHPSRVIQQRTVASLQTLLALRNTAAAGARDLPDLIAHGAGAIAQLCPCAAGDLGNTLHRTG